MLTMAEAQKRTEQFLTGQMLEALRAVEYELPSFDAEPRASDLATAARSQVEYPARARRSRCELSRPRFWRRASDAIAAERASAGRGLPRAAPAVHALDVSNACGAARPLGRLGAEHAGWKFGWRDAPRGGGDGGRRYVETYSATHRQPRFSRNQSLSSSIGLNRHRADDPGITCSRPRAAAFGCRPAAPAFRCKPCAGAVQSSEPANRMVDAE